MNSRSRVKSVEWVAPFVSGVILLAIYLLTLAPTITWAHHGADGGDLVTAVARGSIPHPPGFPAYLMLGGLFIRLPFGNPAWRLNLMSAVVAAGAVALTATAVGHLLHSGIRLSGLGVQGRASAESAVHNSRLAACTALSLGLAPLFWSQAIITEVYAVAALFTLLVTVLALQGRAAWALGLAWGLGTGVHPTLLFLTPLVFWAAWKKPHLAERARFLVQVGILTLLGWGVMYGPVLLARGGVPSPWGDVSTLEGWWSLISGRIYRDYLFGLPPSAWSQRFLAWLGLLARQFTPFGAVLTGLGWMRLWEGTRALALVSTLVFGAFSLYAVGYDTADSLVYLVMALPMAALWLGIGIGQAVDWLSRQVRQGVWAIWLLPLAQALLFWGQMDVSGDWTAMAWAEQVLRTAPPQAVLFTDQDRHTFTLWYVHGVLGERPDVAVIDGDLWALEPYRRTMGTELGIGSVEGDLSPEDAARLVGRPVVICCDNDG